MATLDSLPLSYQQFARVESPDEIWIAEDNLEVRFFLTRAFKRTEPSLHLVFFPNGEELIKHFHGHRELPRMVLLDMEMPVMNGLDALKGIRADGFGLGTPIVIFSSLENPEMIRRAYFCGAKLYLKKPAKLEGFTDVAKLCTIFAETLRSLPADSLPFGALEAKNVLELVSATSS
jgi:CheY-like chemotaxis protein